MALIVEDGTGKADAESFISVADADAYFAARGVTAWAALSTAAKEEALRKATDYMQQQYRGRWKGWRNTAAQALEWPRAGVLDDDPMQLAYLPVDQVPVEVQRACAELASRASAADLSPDLERAQLKVNVGPVGVEYDPMSPEQVRYRAVDASLSHLLLSTGGIMTRVVRT